MSKSKALALNPKCKLILMSQKRWTGINTVWWAVYIGSKEIGKGFNPHDAWRSAYNKLLKT